MEKKPPQAVQK